MPDIFRLYLDQMLRHEVAQALRDEGHDVLRATEVGQARADDNQILQKAISENRVLITLDEHFGDWVILPLSEHYHLQRVTLKSHPRQTRNLKKS
jgi:predicted nuclease of predicted toxin-antitoxin system